MKIGSSLRLMLLSGFFGHTTPVWDTPFLPQGPGGQVYQIASDSTGLYAAGRFWGADDVPARGVARWDGTTWHALGHGLGDRVNGGATSTSLLFDHGKLYAAGVFDSAGEVAARYCAMWDGSKWSDMGTGLVGLPYSLHFWKGTLYAGTDGGVISWSGSSWSATAPGLDGLVLRIRSDSGGLWASGRFKLKSDTSIANLARWDGSKWGVPWKNKLGFIRDFVFLAGDIYAIGEDNNPLDPARAAGVVRWDGVAWTDVPGADPAAGMLALATDGANVFSAYRALPPSAIRVAKSTGAGFSRFQEFSASPLICETMLASAGHVLIAGRFRLGSESGWDNLVEGNGSTWRGFTRGLRSGPYSWATTMASDGKNLFFGSANLRQAAGDSVGHVAGWNGVGWNLLRGGFKDKGVVGEDGYRPAWPRAIAAQAGKVYVGGRFESTMGGKLVHGIAAWDGTDWESMGDGFQGIVNAVDTMGSVLIAGGEPDPDWKGGVHPVLEGQSIGRWRDSHWEKLGAGVSGRVVALAHLGETLIAGGELRIGADTSKVVLAAWNGSSWKSLLSARDSIVLGLKAMCVFHGMVFISGEILYRADPLQTNYYLLTWNGSAFKPVDSIVATGALACDSGTLYVAGLVKGKPGGIVAWDGLRWKSILGPGPTVYDALTIHLGDLYAGGMGLNGVEEKPAYQIIRFRPEGGSWIGKPWAENRWLKRGTDKQVRAGYRWFFFGDRPFDVSGRIMH